ERKCPDECHADRRHTKRPIRQTEEFREQLAPEDLRHEGHARPVRQPDLAEVQEIRHRGKVVPILVDGELTSRRYEEAGGDQEGGDERGTGEFAGLVTGHSGNDMIAEEAAQHYGIDGRRKEFWFTTGLAPWG